MLTPTPVFVTKVASCSALLFIFFLCFFVGNTESRNTALLKKPDVKITRGDLKAIEKLYDGLYAGGYAHGQPIKDYQLEIRRSGKSKPVKRKGKKLRRRKIKKVKVYGGLKNYAKKYQTWTPYKKGSKNRKRIQPPRQFDSFHYNNEVYAPNSSRKRKKKYKMNPLQRPSPPPEPDITYSDYDFPLDAGAEDYFPEEAKDFEEEYKPEISYKRPKHKSRPKKKKKKVTSDPEYTEYTPVTKDEDGVYPPYNADSDQYTVSFSNFVRHPPSNSKKAHSHKKHEYDEFLDESESQHLYQSGRKKRPHRPVTYYDDDERKYGSEYRTKNYYDEFEQDFEPSTARSITKAPSRPVYNPNEIRPTPNYATESFNRPNYEQDFVPNYPVNSGTRYNQQNSPYQDFSNPANVAYNNRVAPFSPSPTADSFTPNYVQPTKQYASPTNFNVGRNPSRPSVPTHYQSSGTTSYTDNTDTYNDYNNNVPVNRYNNAYNKKYHNAEPLPSEITRYNPYSQRNHGVGEDEFMTRHSSLYNNGLSGIPIQGDGFATHSSTNHANTFKRTKEYDIGYGELQYDDNGARN